MSDDETGKPAAPADIEAVRAERKAAKRQAQAERRAAKPAAAPEAQAQRAERKAAKRQAKEAKKRETPDAEAAKAERKAAKQQAKEAKKSKAPDTEAAKAQRKAAKREAKEAAKAAREAKAAEALAARAERKTGKRQAKEAEKVKAPEVLAAKAERKAAKQAAKPEKPPQAKAERKAAKQQTKEAKKAETPEQLAAKAERKAAKQQVKEAKKLKTPEELAAKAERKAAKQAAKPAKSPDAKAERKAAKQQAKEVEKAETPEQLAAKAERKAAKHQAKEAKKAKTPEELAAIAERKAAKQAAKPEKSPDAKAERKAAKQQTKEAKKVKTPEELAAKAERKAAKQQAKEAAPADAGKAEEKAAKKQAKAERKAGKAEKSPEDAAAKAERKAKKAAAKAAGSDDVSEGLSHKERKAAKKAAKSKARADGEGGERSVRLNVAGASPEEVTPLGTALQAAFTAAGAPTEAPKPEGKADVVVHTFDDADAATIERYAAVVAGQKARVHVFVEKLEEGADTARAIARLAALNGGAVVSTRARLKRFGLEQTSSNGRPNEKGLALIAQAIVGIGAARLTKHSIHPQAGEVPGDLAEARAAAEQPMELLGKLRWSSMAPPRAIAASIREEEVLAFADSKVVFSEEASLALATPVDWSVELPDRKAGYIFNGLDFLAGPLTYWYAKANNQGSDRTAGIDAGLKERGSNPNALFVRAAQILVDFIAKHPRSSAPKLWEEELVLRRAPVLALFVLCCRVAYRRKLKFNESAFTTVFNALLDHAEILRADDFYVPCSVDGLKQDSLTIGIALSLRGTAYGSLLVSDTLERLKRLQIDPGLSAEGVWMGDSYGTHNNALGEITGLFADFPPNETTPLEPLTAAAKKMTLFSEAMLKSNGQPPAFDGSKEKSYGNKISGMRKSIARAGGKQVSAGKTTLKTRITDTYVFREAQYFISHSQQKVVPESSLVVLHAAAPSVVHEDPGGVKLVFAYNETNLLVRAEPPEAQGEEEPDETDPGLRNFYRVAGRGNLVPESGSDKTARMVKSWRGPGWAAAKAFEDNYDGASIARTVIHLKAQQALIVVDELESGKEALFEQFWNVGPEFTAPGTMEMPLRFTSDGKGVLSAVLAGAQSVSATKGETATRLRSELLLTQGVAATLFQWTDQAADAALAIERRGSGEWAVTASGQGFLARLNYAGDELSCELAGE
jgi:hypothetical protein